MIYKMADGKRVRVTRTEDGEELQFETYEFDGKGAKHVIDIETLSGAEATRRVTQLTVADSIRFVTEFGINQP